MKEAVGTVSMPIINEVRKTLQLIVYKKYDSQNYILQNHQRIIKYLFSPYYSVLSLLTVMTVNQVNQSK